jgi:hypothetical protein
MRHWDVRGIWPIRSKAPGRISARVGIVGGAVALSLLLLGVGEAAADPAAYVPVYASSNRPALKQAPSNFTFSTVPAFGANYHVTTGHWRDWGTKRAVAKVTGEVYCNDGGRCGSFRASLRATGLRTESRCGVRVYGNMRAYRITVDQTGARPPLTNPPVYVPKSGWRCPGHTNAP